MNQFGVKIKDAMTEPSAVAPDAGVNLIRAYLIRSPANVDSGIPLPRSVLYLNV